MMKNLILICLSFFLISSCTQQDPVPFEDGLEDYPTLQKVLNDKDKYQVQIKIFPIGSQRTHDSPYGGIFLQLKG